MRVLARATKNNKIKLAGIGINNCMEYAAASLDGLLNTEGVCTQIGIDLNATDYEGEPTYQKHLSEYARKYKTTVIYLLISACDVKNTSGSTVEIPKEWWPEII